MDFSKGLSILGMTICMVMMVTTCGCKKSTDAQLVPAGALLQSSGCKQFLANASGQLDGYVPGQHEDCLEYHYNGTDTLVLRHINAGFNCEPGEITANIEFNGNVITITERESQQAAADCLCLFDIDYEIINLAPGEYTIRIIEPYVEEGDQVLELTLRLLSATSGTFCLQRNYYPWI
jgi:hypothetical protein